MPGKIYTIGHEPILRDFKIPPNYVNAATGVTKNEF